MRLWFMRFGWNDQDNKQFICENRANTVINKNPWTDFVKDEWINRTETRVWGFWLIRNEGDESCIWIESLESKEHDFMIELNERTADFMELVIKKLGLGIGFELGIERKEDCSANTLFLCVISLCIFEMNGSD